MTETQKINADAKSAFDKKNYALAFQTLWKSGVANFISYSEKEFKTTNQKTDGVPPKSNWFIHERAGQYFWADFIFQKHVFSDIFNSDSADQLLHIYFSKCDIQVKEFEAKLAEMFPDVFVKAIRVNQVFLKADRIDILNSIQFDQKFHLHQKIWKRVSDIEQSKWKEIQENLSSTGVLSLNAILSHCLIWLETTRYNDNSQQHMYHLGRVYSFFIELVLNKFPEKNQDIIGSDEFSLEFFSNFTATFKEKEKEKTTEHSILKLLESISHWITFMENVIAPYSFDLNIEPIQQNELVYFSSTPEAFYNWLVNGVRYEVNQLSYLFQGEVVVEHLEENRKMKIPGKTAEDIQLNRNLASLKWATISLLNDLAFDTFEIGNTKIESAKLLTPLLTYSFHGLIRYEQSLKIHSQTSQNWSESYMKVVKQSIETTISREPFLLMTESEYEQLNKEALIHLTEDFSKEVVQLFSYKSNRKYEFNRFKQSYDVWQKPFFKIGDFLFCPMMFFASNIWFYSFAQVALSQKTQRNQTQKMETHLGDLLKQKGWNVKVITDKEAGELTGDVDIFVHDNDNLLFIQLKRTYFRLDLKDAYYEAINSDTKAAKQLNEAEEFLKNPNLIYSVKSKPVKWIISTSFENIGNKINGCHKVNYFELLNALKNPETKKLSDLILQMESDKNLKASLEIFESKNYKQIIFSDDEKETENYYSIFNEGKYLNEQSKQNESLVKFQKCISLNPNDADAYESIANILADMKLFDQAFIVFKKALELLPNDPHISKNYALALFEGGRYFDGLELLFELLEKFPLLGDFRILFVNQLEHSLRLGLLNSKQILDLQTKWDSLN
jgi:tetratricopeptide (TPR) repeat protein